MWINKYFLLTVTILSFHQLEASSSLGSNVYISPANQSSELPLHLAVSQGKKHTVQSLLNQGHDIEQRLPETIDEYMEYFRTRDGETPLEIALSNRNLPIIRLLLEQGANPYNYRKEVMYVYSRSNTPHITTFFYTMVSDVLKAYCLECLYSKNDEGSQFYLKVMKLIVRTGFDFNNLCESMSRNNEILSNKTPLDYIRNFKNESVCNVTEQDKKIKKDIEKMESLLINAGAK